MLDEPFEDIPERNSLVDRLIYPLVLLPTSLLCLAYWRLRTHSSVGELERERTGRTTI